MLNSRQRAQLRGMANAYEAIFQVGKGGINDQLIKTVDDMQTVVKEASTSNEPVLYIQGIYPTGKKAYFAISLQE